ncbi:AMP-binding protein [Cumulibacter soli]|uniref:AMP-binding protein n=1 Tax=Cumulibacter soli TaxID=2546344 RepID=UPI00106746A4|nr:AMP-binding protein [Cumulibacter soli]
MTVLSHLSNLAEHDPSATAVLEPVGDDLVAIDRAALMSLALRLRRDLHDQGFGEGDCAAIWLPNWSSALAWQLAVGSLGGHVIGVNTRYNVHEVTHVLTLARPKVVAIADGFVGLDLINRLREAAAAAASTDGWRAPAVVPLTSPGDADVADSASYDVGGGVWLPSADTQPLGPDELSEPTTDQLYLAVTTSGSTGLPKLAAHKQAATLEMIQAAGRAMMAGPGDRLLAALPFSGTFGFVGAFGMLAAGGTIVLHPSFDPAEVVRRVGADGITHLAFGDDMMTRVVEVGRGQDLSNLKWVGMADFQGSSRSLAQMLEEQAGAHVTGLYGSSETFALLTVSGPEIAAPERWEPGGRLTVDSLNYRIADGERVITDGSEGEVQFKGPQAVDAYLGQPHQMEQNYTADGWLRSGDLGRAIDDRAFRYVCRAAEALRLKGFLVEPDEIANHLASHEAVEIAKVVGVRRDAGDEAVGFVTLKPGAAVNGEELVEYCRASLARYKVPVAVYVIDEMPVTTGTNGTKIRAAVLKEWAAERLG